MPFTEACAKLVPILCTASAQRCAGRLCLFPNPAAIIGAYGQKLFIRRDSVGDVTKQIIAQYSTEQIVREMALLIPQKFGIFDSRKRRDYARSGYKI